MYLQIKINKIIMNEFLYILYIFINYVDLLKHFINIDLHLQNINVLSKLNLQRSVSTFRCLSISIRGPWKPLYGARTSRPKGSDRRIC